MTQKISDRLRLENLAREHLRDMTLDTEIETKLLTDLLVRVEVAALQRAADQCKVVDYYDPWASDWSQGVDSGMKSCEKAIKRLIEKFNGENK